jgi:hypothetical protein
MRRDWAASPYVVEVVPGCGYEDCDGTDYIRVRTRRRQDGGAEREVICKTCSRIYRRKLVPEWSLVGVRERCNSQTIL